MEDHETQEHHAVMEPKRFLGHAVNVHMKRRHLTEIIARKEHWIFAMTSECAQTVLQLNRLHQERCGTPIEMVVACCLESGPAFFLFPKESLAYYEIGELLNIEVADSKEQAEKMKYFVLSAQDPKPLDDILRVWLHQDHLLN
jgi:hypothetical protein